MLEKPTCRVRFNNKAGRQAFSIAGLKISNELPFLSKTAFENSPFNNVILVTGSVYCHFTCLFQLTLNVIINSFKPEEHGIKAAPPFQCISQGKKEFSNWLNYWSRLSRSTSVRDFLTQISTK